MAGERFRERRRLPKPGTPRRIELLPQPLVLLAQPVALTLGPLKLSLQTRDLAPRLLKLRDRLALRPRGGASSPTRLLCQNCEICTRPNVRRSRSRMVVRGRRPR
jgi:hypothetical protein